MVLAAVVVVAVVVSVVVMMVAVAENVMGGDEVIGRDGYRSGWAGTSSSPPPKNHIVLSGLILVTRHNC